MARQKNRQPKASAKTAPEVPGKVLKTIDTDAASDEGQNILDEPKQDTNQATANTEQPLESSLKARPAAERSIGDQTAEIDDTATDQAVNDIAAHEADTMLAVQDALGRKHSQPAQSSWKDKLKRLLKSKKTWAVIIILIVVLFAVPATRYRLIGLIIKKPVSVTVVDSRTLTPVSYATVSARGVSVQTNADGVATFKAGPGPTDLLISKQYYKTYDKPLFISLKSGTKLKASLIATGRQVPIIVLNKLTGQPLANAQISALKTTAKTDARGKAVIVLPASSTTDAGTVSLKGYNSLKATIQVTNNVVSANTFNLVPAGHVYFLSTTSGSIDVIKASLDGSNRQTVLGGTGQEDPATTSLLATRDWRYLVLKSHRDTARPVLYLIDTSDDKVTQFDSNNGNFNLIGWYGHDFMYDFVSSTVPQSQTGHEVVKSYDADHLQLNQLDQSQAEGSPSSYVYQGFYNFYVLNSQLAYNTQWYSGGADLTGKNATIRGIQPDGQNKKDYQSFAAAGPSRVLAALYQPQAIYYDAYNSASNTSTYYNFANQTVNTVPIDRSNLTRPYPTYLISPSGNQALWADQQNGANSLFTGDNTAQHPKPLAGLSDYQPYGWFSDSYVLLSKNDTELYIAPTNGLKPGQQAFKISTYEKSRPAYNNYGYGYGGL